MKRLSLVAEQHGWSTERQAEVKEILETSRADGIELMKSFSSDDGMDQVELSKQLLEVRNEELDALDEVLGDEADEVSDALGLRSPGPRKGGLKP